MSNPVVLVPGIGGCELYTSPSTVLVGSQRVWLGYRALLAGFWRVLGLAPDGLSPPNPLYPSLAAGPPLPSYYGICSDWLSSRGWTVFGASLDWRGSIVRDAALLVDTIRTASATGPVRILAHSRGGLVTRQALAFLDAQGELGRVLQVIGLGVPHQGALGPAAILGGWDRFAALVRGLLEIAPKVLVGGYSWLELQAVFASWPGLYQLLPMPGSTWTDVATIDTAYDPATYSAAGLPASATWLAAGRASWSTLPPSAPSIPWIDVNGAGIPTPISIPNPLLLPLAGTFATTTVGDGTVTELSARQPGRKWIATPTAHGALPSDGRLLDVVDQVMRDGLTANVTLTGPILT